MISLSKPRFVVSLPRLSSNRRTWQRLESEDDPRNKNVQIADVNTSLEKAQTPIPEIDSPDSPESPESQPKLSEDRVFPEYEDTTNKTKTPTENDSELVEWATHLKYCQREYGRNHYKTTECLLNLGHTYMRLESYAEALAIFKNVVRIRKSMKGNDHLCVGRALDCVGRAAAHLGELDWGLIALYEAFEIRYKALGPWHVDVADTLNNIAGIFYRMDKMILAEEAYTEVLSVRRAVWGNNHPSVAVTSCSLGKTQLRRSNLVGASASFSEALRIYRVAMNLPDSSQIVKRLLKHISRTERLMVSMCSHI